MIKILCIILTLLTFGGCTLFPPQTRPAAPLPLPAAYSLYTNDEPEPGRWWKSFGSDELNGLVTEALSGNFDVKTAWSRLKQADVVARQAGRQSQTDP